MDVTVALNSDKRRDLEFFSGDDTVIVLTVYLNDGDTEPVTISDPQLLYNTRSKTPGETFRAAFDQREPYTIVGTYGSMRRTIAYGLLIRKWDYCPRDASDGMYEPLFVRNEVSGGVPGSYFEGPGTDGGGVT